MDHIRRNIKCSDGERRDINYPVYTQEEADDRGIEYRKLRDVTGAHQWVLSDDGYVAEVIRVNGPYPYTVRGVNIPRYEVWMCYCRAWNVNSNKKLLYIPFRDAKVYSWHTPHRATAQEVKSGRFKRALKRYAFFYITQGGVLSEQQMKDIGMLYRPKEKIPEASFKSVIRTYEGKAMLKNELKRLMEEHGVTPEHVIRQQQEIIDLAKADGQLGVAEKANGRFIDMMDLMPDKGGTMQMSSIGGVSWTHLEAPEEAKEIPLEAQSD